MLGGDAKSGGNGGDRGVNGKGVERREDRGRGRGSARAERHEGSDEVPGQVARDTVCIQGGEKLGEMGGELGGRDVDVVSDDIESTLDDEGGGDSRGEERASRKGVESAVGRLVDALEIVIEEVGDGEAVLDGGVRLRRR